MTLVWVPFEVAEPPAGLDLEIWDGTTGWPDSVAEVELFVVPYMSGSRGLAPIPQMSSLRVVQTLTAGYDDILPLIPAGITVCNAPGVHDASTAELGVALLLASIRRFPEFVRATDTERWMGGPTPALADRRVLIIGYGSVGAALERRLAGFEVEVQRVARTPRDSPAGPVVGLDQLDALVPHADVIVLCVPLTEDTRGLVDAAFLASMKDGALLVNIARGAVVDTDALLHALESGRLRAALDVTDPEPLPAGHPLWHAPGLLLSPHVGGNTSAFAPRAARLLADQLRRFAQGHPLAGVVRP